MRRVMAGTVIEPTTINLVFGNGGSGKWIDRWKVTAPGPGSDIYHVEAYDATGESLGTAAVSREGALAVLFIPDGINKIVVKFYRGS